jgi:hypothetical protein
VRRSMRQTRKFLLLDTSTDKNSYGHEGGDDCNFEFDEDRDDSDEEGAKGEIDVDEI